MQCFLHFWASGASRLNPACFFCAVAARHAPNGLTATRVVLFLYVDEYGDDDDDDDDDEDDCDDDDGDDDDDDDIRRR